MAEEKTEAQKIAERKAAKAKNAKRWAENKKAEREERTKNAQLFVKYLEERNQWAPLPDNLKKFLQDMANPVAAGQHNNSTFRLIFGDNAKVGDSITLLDAVKKTLKGKSNIDFYVKKWAENDTVVEFKQAPNILESVYVIKALGANPGATKDNKPTNPTA